MNALRRPSAFMMLCLLAGLAMLLSFYTLKTSGHLQGTIKRKTQDLARLQHLSSQLVRQEGSRDRLRQTTTITPSNPRSFLASMLKETPHTLTISDKADAGENWTWQTLELSIPSIAYVRFAPMLEALTALPAPPRMKELTFTPGPETGVGRLHVQMDTLTPPSR